MELFSSFVKIFFFSGSKRSSEYDEYGEITSYKKSRTENMKMRFLLVGRVRLLFHFSSQISLLYDRRRSETGSPSGV